MSAIPAIQYPPPPPPIPDWRRVQRGSSQTIPDGPHPRAGLAWMGRDWRALQRLQADWRRVDGLPVSVRRSGTPSPWCPTRISKDLHGCIPAHSRLAWVWSASGSNYPITKLPIYQILPVEHGSPVPASDSRVFKEHLCKQHTLGRCRSIAILFAHINGELVHGPDKPMPQKHVSFQSRAWRRGER